MSKRIGELLDAVLAGAGLETTAEIWRIGEAWDDAVGPTIAEHAAPLRLVRGELVVAAPLAVWRQELALLGPEIVANINLKLSRPVVERIRLVAAPLGSPEAPRETRRRLRVRAAEGKAAAAWSPSTVQLREDLSRALEALHHARNLRLAEDLRAREGGSTTAEPGRRAPTRTRDPRRSV